MNGSQQTQMQALFKRSAWDDAAGSMVKQFKGFMCRVLSSPKAPVGPFQRTLKLKS